MLPQTHLHVHALLHPAYLVVPDLWQIGVHGLTPGVEDF